ncbi:MAG: CpsD/CapB family tyrosine-protein kinase [Desulfobacterales bacterium]|nr:CpsD/CapB family tyrosine-protein kinase [Desulfobacterales bacterium]
MGKFSQAMDKDLGKPGSPAQQEKTPDPFSEEPSAPPVAKETPPAPNAFDGAFDSPPEAPPAPPRKKVETPPRQPEAPVAPKVENTRPAPPQPKQAPPRPAQPQPAQPKPAQPRVAQPKPEPARQQVEEPYPEFVSKDPRKRRFASSAPKLNKVRSGQIPKGLITATKPNSIASEQFRLLKNNILFPEKGTPPRSIMITSPSPNEGKSFVAANLAVSIANSIDEYVLLMDCDLRAPTIHQLFEMDGNRGLSDYLSSGIPLAPLLSKSFLDKLTVLPGGQIPPNPSELLSSEQMRRLLSELKSRYSDRYIIVDAPPPNITSETNAIARIVDGIIIVIRQGITRKKDVQDIIDIYGRDKILGVIKNFSTKQPVASYRYQQYGYPKN